MNPSFVKDIPLERRIRYRPMHQPTRGRCDMVFGRLCKAQDSRPADQCPAIYTTDDPAWLIAQGKILDEAERLRLIDLARDESAVRIPTETVIRSVALLLAEHGQPDLAADVERALQSAWKQRAAAE